jgi:hypothetical protein
MSPKQPSKDKRAAQNRNQRAARAARAANANAAPAPQSHTPGTGGGSLLSRLRGGGASRPATRNAGARLTAAQLRAQQPPGYRAALSGVFAAVAAVLLCMFALRYPVDAQGDLYTKEHLAADWSLTALRAAADAPEATAAAIAESIDDWSPGRSKETVIQALWPFSLAIVLPLAGAGIALQAVRKRASSKAVNRALYATLFGAVLTQGLLLLFLPVVLAVGVAMFQVRKAESLAAAAAADGVIDVDEVDELDELDELDEVDAAGEVIDVDEADDADEPRR